MWYFSEKELLDCPSHNDGIPLDKVDVYRFKGCELIEKLAAVFRLPKLCVASAKVFFHRYVITCEYLFFALHSFKKYDAWLIAVTCLFLAAKVEEHYVKAVDLSKHYLAQRKKLCHESKASDAVHPKMPVKPHTVESQTEELLFTECIVLHVLAYDLGVIHPYAYVNEFVQLGLACLDSGDDVAVTLKRGAWSFLNDSSNTWLCLRFEPRVIAAAAVYLAGCYAALWTPSLDETTASLWSRANMPVAVLADAAKTLLDTYNKGYSYKKLPLPEGILKLLVAHGQCNLEKQHHRTTDGDVGTAIDASSG
ncbi:Aste57867_22212 [Aphanomyces stellatus]|uniref:Aste57867_22212 protein n=1 Tax=Aphanomyces stellatus TaxID=120398 RepID=A0A485LJI9_9STRA|nr:hypothetical protein As57867_022143 [Aphanomyces stellatus]VFT98879.1 Aste57867_22212 [Aphanomyces stellatus]